MTTKYYVVISGRIPGIYKTWKECQEQTHKFSGARFKSFTSKEDAEAYFNQGQPSKKRKRDSDDAEDDQPSQKRLKTDQSNTMVIYTDGACRNNGTPNAKAGYGVFFGDDDARNTFGRLEGREQTNNRAELTAIIKALECLDKSVCVLIKTDSNYSIDAVEKYTFVKNKSKLKNADLIEQLYKLVHSFATPVTLEHVDAHCGIYGNERADELSNRALLL